MKIRFTRDTKPNEGQRLFRAGQEVDVSTSSMRHWLTRNAAIVVKPTTPEPEGPAAHNRTVKAMEQQIAEIANAQPAAPVANAAPDSGSAGDGTKPDTGPSAVGAFGGRSGGRSK